MVLPDLGRDFNGPNGPAARPSASGYPRFWGFPRLVGGAIMKKPSPCHSLPQGGGYKRNGRLGASATGQRSAAAPCCGLLDLLMGESEMGQPAVAQPDPSSS